ncbi:MAG: hypothetical protein RL318_762 [Fibrobacterota bacterium]|jgi:hypothetical protein
MIRKVLCLSLAWLGGCAVVQAPSGGPVDSSAVVVLRTVPENGAVKVDRNQVIELQWNKWIQATTLGKNLTISPTPPSRTRIEIDGDRVKLSFTEPLDSPATYSVRFAPGIKDWRDGKSQEEISLVFATGTVMDSGTVEVKTFVNGAPANQAPTGTRVGLYPADSLRRTGLKRLLKSRDSTQWLSLSPMPLREKPLYSAIVDSLGIARLRHIPPGRYLAVANTDRGGDGFCRTSSDSAATLGVIELTGPKSMWRGAALLGRIDTVTPKKDSVDTTKWTKVQRDSVHKVDSLALVDSLKLDSLTALDTARPSDSMAYVILADTALRDSSHPGLNLASAPLWARAWPMSARTRPVMRPFVAGRARLPLKPGRWRIEVWQDRDGNGRPTPSNLLRGEFSEAYWLWRDRTYPASFEGDPDGVLKP